MRGIHMGVSGPPSESPEQNISDLQQGIRLTEVSSQARENLPTRSFSKDLPEQFQVFLNSLPSNPTAGTLLAYRGKTIGLNPASDPGAIVEIAVGRAQNYVRLTKGQVIRSPVSFDRFFIRNPSGGPVNGSLVVLIDIFPDQRDLPYTQGDSVFTNPTVPLNLNPFTTVCSNAGTGTEIIVANLKRKGLILQNTDAANTVLLGTPSNCLFPLGPGNSLSLALPQFAYCGPIWGLALNAPVTIAGLEFTP